ncbi:GNAT family N-acetyltransferase [Streptomyces phaeoluteigriseus]|uniref:GNAT family N-acetyltransferase n=1 Tax=Streptomyces phaeoluteigriseus TaxID=114686 RepID=A0ABY4Z434_9ACTN|nr:GNAT family N-acetyltransferase [Streptomyces phaeoluteigriseus]USQ83445.1 GNAT family N-acetyltransferase [Streptomyces phaeoluteigriseus]
MATKTITGDFVDGVVRAWVDGWVVSRGAAPPVREPWGFTVDVGQSAHVSRHVLAAVGDGVEEQTVRKVADGVTATGVWLKVFQDPALVGRWLGDGWWVDPEPGWLMTVPLPAHGGHARVPDGYRLRRWTRGGVTRLLVTTPDGSFAARGQLAPTGVTAVFDQIETAPGHQRRGLGSLVMRTLAETAAAEGAETGVLAGTPAGRALYESLGWTVTAPMTSAKFTGDGRASSD